MARTPAIQSEMPPEFRRLQDQLRANERIWSGFRKMEIALLGARSLREIVTIVTHDLPKLFPGVDRACLAHLDPQHEMRRLIRYGSLVIGLSAAEPSVSAPDDAEPDGFVAVTDSELARLFANPGRPLLGAAPLPIQTWLFPASVRPLGSMALAPLVLRGRLVGCLAQGSREPRHFTPDVATDLLEHLAAVLAVCLDNLLSHERLKLDGLTDPLTGIANRRFFERRLKEEVNRLRRTGKPLSGMLVDLDHFKQVNDTHGHQAGDRVLHRVAQLLGMEMRATDVLARYGGEEFVMLLPETGWEQASAIAERLRNRVASHPVLNDPAAGSVRLTVSIGCACLDADTLSAGGDENWLVEQADMALYEAKKRGRNRVVRARPAAAIA
jgi:diguanylate cyclase (GGDEF)-like protein